MANDKPDVIGWLRATGLIVIGLSGLVVTVMIGRMQADRSEHEFAMQEDRSKHEFRTQAMVQRERSETEFRQAMFHALAAKMFGTQDDISERLRYFEVFQLNFHNLFNARPLYDLLAEEIEVRGEAGLRADLESLGKRIAKNQATIILAAQDGKGQHFLELKLSIPDTVRLPSLDHEEETDSTDENELLITLESEEETDSIHEHESGEHVLLITLEEVEAGRARVKVETNPDRPDSDSWKSEYWTATFSVQYYDAPFTDNTLLPDGHRIALNLWRTTDSTASVTVLEFPADFITVAYRPSFHDLDEIQEHLHDANE